MTTDLLLGCVNHDQVAAIRNLDPIFKNRSSVHLRSAAPEDWIDSALLHANNGAAFHHQPHRANSGNVQSWIPLNSDQVGEEARLYRADVMAHPHPPRVA